MAILQALGPRLHTADGRTIFQDIPPVVVGVSVQAPGPVFQHLIQPFAVEKGGVPHALCRQLTGFVQQSVRRFLVQHQRHRRRGGLRVPHRPQAQVGKLVGRILPLLVQAAHIQMGIAVIPAKDIGHLGRLEPHVGGHPHIQLLDQLHGALRRQDALFDVRFVVRIHILVEPSPGDGRPRPFHEQEEAHSPSRLAGIIEGGGRPPGDAGHHLCHLLQFLLAHRVCFLGGFPGAGGGHPLAPLPNGLQHLDNAVVENALVYGFRVVGVQGRPQRLGLFIILHEPMLDHIRPGRDEVGAVGAQVVGHVRHAAKLCPVPFLGVHVMAPLNGHGLLLPVWQKILFQLLILLIRDLKGVVGPTPQVGQVVG